MQIPVTQINAAGLAGESVLLYDYTVVGVDKATIDTGTDTPDAGTAGTSAFSGAFRVLEIMVYGRTDTVAAFELVQVNFNNDTSAIYDRINMRDTNVTLAQDNSLAQTAVLFNCAGASLAANVFATYHLRIPNYAGTVGNKFGYFDNGTVDTAAANTRIQTGAIGYRSTSAITRVSLATLTGGRKFVVGTRLLVYAS